MDCSGARLPNCVRTLVAMLDQERLLFRSVLGLLPHVMVITETDDGRVALECVRRWRLDLALLGIPLVHLDGLTVARRALRVSPGIRVAIITTIDDPACLLEALRIGVNGYLSACASVDDLADAIRHILAGETLFDIALSTRALQRLAVTGYAR
ncbi:MAG: response regulator transcription factor [Roseiflexus sp.]|nr:response regulator transcription factor [Roseiflexus sp.]MCS7289458.1 response regulator transcription factor [Roseiflexus sp.]MDW8144925.1 response regulator transcription factor [Roseiflexaceae bacterium]MDW8234306.1 response regulator transcription factor [Roseiflexaceae bacterium]